MLKDVNAIAYYPQYLKFSTFQNRDKYASNALAAEIAIADSSAMLSGVFIARHCTQQHLRPEHVARW